MLGAISNENLVTLAIWGGLGLVGLVVFAIVVYVARGRLHPARDQNEKAACWDLHTLDILRERGDLTVEEYRTLRARTIETLSEGIGERPPG